MITPRFRHVPSTVARSVIVVGAMLPSWFAACGGDTTDDVLTACTCCCMLAALIVGGQIILILVPDFFFEREPPLAAQPPRPWRQRKPIAAEAATLAAVAFNATTGIINRAPPHMLLYRDVEATSDAHLFERIAAARSVNNELLMLTSDKQQLPLTLNLVAQLDGLGIGHHLVLGRDSSTCHAVRRRGRVACFWSTYLMGNPQGGAAGSGAGAAPSSPSPSGRRKKVPPVELLWLQRHHYVGRAIGAGLNVLLLDSDVAVSRSPYPYLKSPPLNRFHAVVLGDSTGAAKPLHLNGGVWYLQNCSRDGPLRELFRRFDEHALRAVQLGEGSSFDQQILNSKAATLLPVGPLVWLLNAPSTSKVVEAYVDAMPSMLWHCTIASSK